MLFLGRLYKSQVVPQSKFYGLRLAFFILFHREEPAEGFQVLQQP